MKAKKTLRLLTALALVLAVSLIVTARGYWVDRIDADCVIPVRLGADMLITGLTPPEAEAETEAESELEPEAESEAEPEPEAMTEESDSIGSDVQSAGEHEDAVTESGEEDVGETTDHIAAPHA